MIRSVTEEEKSSPIQEQKLADPKPLNSRISRRILIQGALLGAAALVLGEIPSSVEAERVPSDEYLKDFPRPDALVCLNNHFPEKLAAASEFDKRYPLWTSRFITTQGAGGYKRVVLPEKNNETVSEGLGFGMIFSVVANDKAKFDSLWGYTRNHVNSHGLTPWDIDSSGKILDYTAATDGEEDIALALILAYKKWGRRSYKKGAKDRLAAMMSYQVESGTYVLKPGDTWGGSNTTNPSYFSPAYYKIFAQFTGNQNWLKVTDKCYEIIGNVNVKSGATTGLQPDWCQASGDPVTNMNYNYQWDATRVPLRLAMDALWFCDQRAIDQLNKINQFIANLGPEKVKEGFTLDGQPLGLNQYAVFLAPLTAGSTISQDSVYQQNLWDRLQSLPDKPDYYYDPALRLFSLAIASDKLTNPLA